MTTNYRNTFIAVAPDCPAPAAEKPPLTGTPTVAALQFALVSTRPYQLTSDEILFEIHATRMNLPDSDRESEWKRFFAKDQACLRASPLAKRYGWGTHHDENGRVALIPFGTDEYDTFASRADLVQKVAMRSSRA